MADWSRAIELDPKGVPAWISRGMAYSDLGQHDKAIADFSHATELDPQDVQARTSRGEAYGLLGQHEKALADFSKAIELDPHNARPHNDLAWLLATCPDARYRDTRRAVELAEKAVNMAPKESYCWNTLGVARYRAGNWKGAIAALEKSMALGQGGTSYDWFFLAMTHRELGHENEARRWFERAVQGMEKIAPTSEELRRFRAEAEDSLKIRHKESKDTKNSEKRAPPNSRFRERLEKGVDRPLNQQAPSRTGAAVRSAHGNVLLGWQTLSLWLPLTEEI